MPHPRQTPRSALPWEERLAVHVHEYCALMDMPMNTARKLIRQGDIPTVKVGRSVYIPRSFYAPLLAS